MNIIIDTNLLHSDWMLRSADAVAFLEFVKRTGSIIYIPRIVWEETRINYRKDIEKKHQDYEKYSKIFGSNLVDKPELVIVNLDYNDETSKYLEWLSATLKLKSNDAIIPYSDYTERIANRALSKRKPSNKINNNEYKDTLVWETVLDIVQGNIGRATREVTLISNDAGAFEADKISNQSNAVRQQKAERQIGALHPHLKEDIDTYISNSTVERFYYYNSLGEFLASHYTHIKGVNEDLVRNFFCSKESNLGRIIWDNLSSNWDILLRPIAAYNAIHQVDLYPGQLAITSLSLIKDFYTYSQNDTITVSGIVEITLEVVFLYSNSSFLGKNSYTLNPIIDVKFSLEYLEDRLQNLDAKIVNVPPGDWLLLPKKQQDLNNIFSFYKAAENSFWNEEALSKLDFNDHVSVEERINKLSAQGKASNSKYIPRKTGTESRKVSKPKYGRRA